MNSKKIFSIMLTMTLGISMLSGCGSKQKDDAKNNKEAEIVIWHQYEPGVEENLKKSFDNFTKENKNIKVKFIKQNELSNKITLSGQSQKDVPDIILGPNDWAGRFSVMGIVEPVSGHIDSKILDNHIKPTIEALTYKDELYGVPMTYECLTFMYNKKLLDKAPQNTDELLAMMKEKKQGDKWGFLDNIGDAYHAMPWIYGNKGFAIDKDGKPGLNSAEVEAALNFIKEMKPYLPKNIDYNVMDGLFKEGKAAAVMNGSWAIKDYKANKNIELGVELLPVISSTGKKAQPFLGVQAAYITKGCKNKEAAGKVLEYFASEDIAKAFADAGYLVANKKVDLSNDPIAKKLSEQADLCTPMPCVPEMSNVWEPLANALKEVATKDNPDIKAILEKAQKDAEEKIKAAK